MPPKKPNLDAPHLTLPGPHRFIGEDTVMSDLVRAFDWSATPLGSIDTWTVSLKTVVSIILNSKHPMFLWWGQELIQIYNDAYLPSFGNGKHPVALGQRGIDCWQEIWPIIWPQIETVLCGGASSWYEDKLVPIWRNGGIEEVYWTYTYTPVFDDKDAIAGVLVVCMETTGRIQQERRQQTLTLLAKGLVDSRTENDVLEQVMRVAQTNPADIRFVTANEGSTDDQDVGPLVTLNAADLGLTQSFSLTFGLNVQVPFDTAYRHFLEQFTASAGAAMTQVLNVCHARSQPQIAIAF